MICRTASLTIAFWSFAALAPCMAVDSAEFSGEDLQHFESKIRPLLAERCYSCHSSEAKTVHGGLRLDSRQAIRQGGDSGPLLDSANLADSFLLEVIRYDGDIQMPPAGKLPDHEIAELTRWIRRGLPFPATIDRPLRGRGKIDIEQGREFWSFRPLQRHAVPKVRNQAWPRTAIDSFVLAAMERNGLAPSPRAERATLIRRLYFDLTGLPPKPADVRGFIENDSPVAYAMLVERLLDSPQHGEKWARMWLDLARYTDRTASWLYQTGQAHYYRDWVVRAFNDDMRYDAFIHRQLATDLMPETGPVDLPALGFISLSPTYWKELMLPCDIIKVIVADEWEERVDAVTRTFLGLTVACARCHDHKFDPISSADYYALAGVFASCRQVERPLIAEDAYQPVRMAKKEIAELETKITALKKTKPPRAKEIDALLANIDKIKRTTPLFDTPIANALSEESLYIVQAGETAQDGTRLEYRPGPRDLPIFVRGNPNRPGPVVRRRFLSVLSEQERPFGEDSGRLALAKAMTTDAAQLTARVIVNRVWLAHFGRGLVTTPSNFGQQGTRPTHPELLNDLAFRFVDGGWSLKDLHREILLSATWQQSSAATEQQIAADPDNRWLSRMNRRRLDFEAWRDSMLFSSKVLDLATYGPSSALEDSENRRRTLYATVHRREMSTTLQMHDFPDPTQHSPQRNFTVTALQGLYALNGPLLTQQSQALADRLSKEIPGSDRARIDRAYWLLFSRAPSKREQQLAVAFIGDSSDEERTARWQQYAQMLFASNEFLFVD